jgi:flagellar hook-associated protein 1
MSSLFGTMSIALSGLMADQAALEITTNNVANANTVGYSRQRAVLVEGDPVVEGSLTFGSGVVLKDVQSVRDSILELRLNDETQQQSQWETTVSSMQPLEVMFSQSGSDLGTEITKLFSSLQQLSTAPADLSLRQGVLGAAGDLASSFHSTVQNLQAQRGNLDLNVGQSVDQINVLTGQIAALNRQISALENLHENAGTFVDQRTTLIRQLSGLLQVSVVKSDNTITVTTAAGQALVAGERSFTLTAQADPSGVQHIYVQGADITGTITGGSLGGLLDVRDHRIPDLLSNLDTLAAGLATALNAAHHGGADLNGAPGGDLFVPPGCSEHQRRDHRPGQTGRQFRRQPRKQR